MVATILTTIYRNPYKSFDVPIFPFLGVWVINKENVVIINLLNY